MFISGKFDVNVFYVIWRYQYIDTNTVRNAIMLILLPV